MRYLSQSQNPHNVMQINHMTHMTHITRIQYCEFYLQIVHLDAGNLHKNQFKKIRLGHMFLRWYDFYAGSGRTSYELLAMNDN